MTTRRSMVAAVLASALTLIWVAPATAQINPQYSQFGSVQTLEAGWTENAMSVQHSAPMVNPNSCAVTNAGYATNPADPGHNLFHTMLLSSFLNRKEVSLLISGCVFGKPRVIAVKIR